MPFQPATPDFPARFHVAVDVVALTIIRGLLQVAVVQRTSPTSCVEDGNGTVHESARTVHDYALPGGHVDPAEEDLEDAAIRELWEETGISVQRDDLVQIGAFGARGRDPRPGRTVSVAFLAFSREFRKPVPGSDAAGARFVDVVDLLTPPKRLEFDHSHILSAGIQRLRELLERTPIATRMLGETFTMSELRRVYEVVFHPAYDPGADLRRDVEALRKEEPDEERQEAFIVQGVSNRLAEQFREEVSNLQLGYGIAQPEQLARRIERALSSEMRGSRPSNRPGTARVRDRFRLRLDAANFARKVAAVEVFVTKVPEAKRLSESGSGRMAQLYRAGPGTRFDTPLTIDRPSATRTKSSRRTTP